MTPCLPSTDIVEMYSQHTCTFLFLFFPFSIKIKNYDIFRGGLFKFLINRN